MIWLHPYSYASGYTEGYNVQDTTVYHRLAKEGFAVLAFDQCGFGLRLLEGTRFYERHPRWSRLGRMVHDVRRAVGFLAEGKGRAEDAIPEVRRDRVCVLGYSLGGMVGLYAAALDERIAAVACFAGFTPLRSDTDAQPTGGNRRLYEQHALQPRLGYFRGREEEVPYDFEDVLALVAPRPCLLVSPLRDRHADAEAVARTVTVARKAWEAAGAPEALTHLSPDDVSRFQSDQHRIFLDWIRGR
ncbi:MAG: alpha/beta fold hydrolase [Planctomycetota bacterium]